MEQQRWRQVEQIYHSAKERDSSQRHAFLAEACRDDEDLRREIESLLAQDTSRECVLDRPPLEAIGNSTASLLGAHMEPDRLDPFFPGTLLAVVYKL